MRRASLFAVIGCVIHTLITERLHYVNPPIRSTMYNASVEIMDRGILCIATYSQYRTALTIAVFRFQASTLAEQCGLLML